MPHYLTLNADSLKTRLQAGEAVTVPNPEPLPPELPDDMRSSLAQAYAETIGEQLGLTGLVVTIPDSDQLQIQLPAKAEQAGPPTPLLDVFRELVAQAADKTGVLVLVALPRHLSLKLLGDYAQVTRKQVQMHQLAVIRDTRLPHIIMVVDGVPVIATPMAAPMMCGYIATQRHGSLRGAEEHPVYPAVLFNRRLADNEPKRLPKFAQNCMAHAITIVSKLPADIHIPLTSFEPPPPSKAETEAKGSGALPADDEEALLTIRQGLLERKEEILASTAKPTGSYEIHIVASRTKLISAVRDMIEDMLPTVTTAASKADDSVVITIMKRLIA